MVSYIIWIVLIHLVSCLYHFNHLCLKGMSHHLNCCTLCNVILHLLNHFCLNGTPHYLNWCTWCNFIPPSLQSPLLECYATLFNWCMYSVHFRTSIVQPLWLEWLATLFELFVLGIVSYLHHFNHPCLTKNVTLFVVFGKILSSIFWIILAWMVRRMPHYLNWCTWCNFTPPSLESSFFECDAILLELLYIW